MGKKLDIEKNDAPNYWKFSNDTNKHYVDIMNTKSDFSESEYNSVSKLRIFYLNAKMSEISFELFCSQKFWAGMNHMSEILILINVNIT